MVESLNYAYDHGELSNSQRRAIITLIEKKVKDRRDISNWRPISLINVDVKLVQKPSLNDWRLSCLVSYTTINLHMSKIGLSATLLGLLRIFWTTSKRYQIEGRLVSIDFKKAFDSVSRDFCFGLSLHFTSDLRSNNGSKHFTPIFQAVC